MVTVANLKIEIKAENITVFYEFLISEIWNNSELFWILNFEFSFVYFLWNPEAERKQTLLES